MFEIKPKYEESVYFYDGFCSFHCVCDEIAMFCFGKFYFLLVVQGMCQNKNMFGVPDSVYLVDNITPPNIGQYWNIFTYNIDTHKTKWFTH